MAPVFGPRPPPPHSLCLVCLEFSCVRRAGLIIHQLWLLYKLIILSTTVLLILVLVFRVRAQGAPILVLGFCVHVAQPNTPAREFSLPRIPKLHWPKGNLSEPLRSEKLALETRTDPLLKLHNGSQGRPPPAVDCKVASVEWTCGLRQRAL